MNQEKDAKNIYMPAEMPGESLAVNGLSESYDLKSNILPFPHYLPKQFNLFISQAGKAYAQFQTRGGPIGIYIGSRTLNNFIREEARKSGINIRKNDIYEINEYLVAHAESSGIKRDIYLRVAPIEHGIEIDLADDQNTRIQVVNGSVLTLSGLSQTLFYRSVSSSPMVTPSDFGDLTKIYSYLNMSPQSALLCLAWISYTLAHPKIDSSKYLILVLAGNQGTGKSSFCKNIIQRLIDPNNIGVQIFPNNPKDIAIAAKNCHVVCYDNIRDIKPYMSDVLCIAATGGALTTRALYTDSDQQVLHLHVALVLNGIHAFIDQADLAQRCLTIEMLPIESSNRQSETEMEANWAIDLPIVFRGILDLIASIFIHLPNIQVMYPERMLDFVNWLAAMEKAMNLDPGHLQGEYSRSLNQDQFETLSESLLGVAIMDMKQDQKGENWSGTPADLYHHLASRASWATKRSHDWPANPIALSKRLRPIQASLMSQGITLSFSRGKQRTITITFEGTQNAKVF